MFKSTLRTAALMTACLATASAALVNTTPAEAAPTLKPKVVLKPQPKPVQAVVTIKLKDINVPLVPNELMRGDREFGGNGPNIDSNVELVVADGGKRIRAKIYFHAKETKSDWSETRGSWERTVYVAPSGKTIDRIMDPTKSSVAFTSKKAGFQVLGPSSDYWSFFQKFMKVHQALLMFASPTAPLEAKTPEQKAMKSMVDKVMNKTAALLSDGNHVHLEKPSSGPVSLFAIVGDTGGDDISTDLNPKDDTRIEAISFKPLRVTFK